MWRKERFELPKTIDRSLCDNCVCRKGIIEFNHACLCSECFDLESERAWAQLKVGLTR